MYIDLIHILKPDLSHWQPSQEDGFPEHLPFATHDFLKLCLNFEEETTKLMWHTLWQVAWMLATMKSTSKNMAMLT